MKLKIYLVAFLAGTGCHALAVFVGLPFYSKVAAPIETYIALFEPFFGLYAATTIAMLLDGAARAITSIAPFAFLLGGGLSIILPANRLLAARFGALSLLLWNISSWLWLPVPFFGGLKWVPIAWFAEASLVTFVAFITGSQAGFHLIKSDYRL